MTLRLSVEEDSSEDENPNGVDWLKEVEAMISPTLTSSNVTEQELGSSLPTRCTTPSAPVFARERFVPSWLL